MYVMMDSLKTIPRRKLSWQKRMVKQGVNSSRNILKTGRKAKRAGRGIVEKGKVAVAVWFIG